MGDIWNTSRNGMNCVYCGKRCRENLDIDDGIVYDYGYYCDCDKGKLEITQYKNGLSLKDIKNLSNEEAKQLAKKYWK